MKPIHILLISCLCISFSSLPAQSEFDYPENENPEKIHAWLMQHRRSKEIAPSNKRNLAYRPYLRFHEEYNSTWEQVDSITFSYVKEDLVNESNQYRWQNGNLDHIRRSIFSYNAMDDFDTLVTQRQDNGMLQNLLRTIWNYDSVSHKLAYFTEQLWNGSIWENRVQTRLTLDSAGNTSIEAKYNWVNGNWQNQRQTLYTWNNNHAILTSLLQSWDTTNTQWENVTLLEFTYPSMSSLDPDSIKRNSWQNGNWQQEYLMAYEFNANMQQTVRLDQRWDTLTQNWRNSSKWEYSYIPSGQDDTRYFYSWNAMDMEWKNNLRYVYEYDSLDNNSLWIVQLWSNDDSAFVNFNRNLYFYESYQTTGIDPKLNSGISHKVYPNPFNERLQISFENANNKSSSLEIYSLNGQRLIILTASADPETLTWDGKDAQGHKLPAGIYIYHLQVGEKKEVERFG